MPHIVLTEEQTRILAESPDPIEVRDNQGEVVASIQRFNAIDREMIERYKRRKGQPNEPSISSSEVQAHLCRLEEIRQSEGMDEAKMKLLLRRMRAGEQV